MINVGCSYILILAKVLTYGHFQEYMRVVNIHAYRAKNVFSFPQKARGGNWNRVTPGIVGIKVTSGLCLIPIFIPY